MDTEQDIPKQWKRFYQQTVREWFEAYQQLDDKKTNNFGEKFGND